jgi:membrane-bound lytic murein transglycosylase A
MTGAEAAGVLCSDDLSYRDISTAIQNSISYFKRLPSDRKFIYGSETYTPGEMIESLSLFLETLSNYKGEELVRRLSGMFDFYESINDEGMAFITGYYEPVIDGSREPGGRFTEPVYAVPDDLVEVDLGLFSERWANEKIVGKVDKGRLVPYDTRSEIVYERSLEGRARPIAYLGEIDLFFLQIQGSGIIRLRNGDLMRVNYASKNGRPYFSIGRALRDVIPEEEMSLQSIRKYLEDHPSRVREILSHNESYVFFREVDKGPLGDIEVPLVAGRSIAMDRRYTPRGGLALLKTVIPEYLNGTRWGVRSVCRYVLVQDTGGAIRGYGRADLFLGRGRDAELMAGALRSFGRIFLIVAKKEYLGTGGGE